MPSSRLAFALSLVAALLIGLLARPYVARASDGAWTCYIADRMDRMDKAGTYGEGKMVAEGLNARAPSTPKGTVVPVTWGRGPNDTVGLVCVKE